MSATIINLIIQLIAGAIGGNAAGAAAKNVSLGTGGNTIAGAVGGIAGGSLLTSLIPMLSGGAGGMDIGALGRPAGRRRRVRRDRDRDRRSHHEQDEGRLSAFGAGKRLHLRIALARRRAAIYGSPACGGSRGEPRREPVAGSGSTNSWD